MTGDLPVTVAAAGLLGLLHVGLGMRVTLTRFTTKQSLGTGGDDSTRFGHEKRASPLLIASRAHANLTENVPLALILLGIAEHDLGQVWFVILLALLLVVARGLMRSDRDGDAGAQPVPRRRGAADLGRDRRGCLARAAAVGGLIPTFCYQVCYKWDALGMNTRDRHASDHG